MKKLLALLAIAPVMLFIACEEETTPPVYDIPTVTATVNGGSLANGATGQTATFNVTIASPLTADWTATGTGVTVSTASGELTASGAVNVTFAAGTTAGAASVTLVVTDSEGRAAQATIVYTVLAPNDAPITFNTNGNIPATASIKIGETLAVSGVDVASTDGVASVSVSVNGAANSALSTTYTGNNATETFGFSVAAADLGIGVYTVLFTATDKNGSTATFSHALTVGPPAIPVKIISSNIDKNTTWSNDTIYELGTRVTVLDGFTLTIEAGTVIKGQPGTGAASTALLVARGGKLNAMGTATSPIIFTTTEDQIYPGIINSPNMSPTTNGKWGGVLILGKAPISASADEVQIEGIPTSDPNGLYGGTVADDNSGTIKYISIRHGGTLIGSGNEINGLTLGGVGSGTVIEHVEIVGNQDDGIEFFGGTVSVKWALVWNSYDDALDTDQAWNGTCENFIVVAPNTGSGFELDGPEGTLKQGDHTFKKGIVYAGANIADLIDFDANSNVKMDSIYFFGISNSTVVKEYAAMIAFAGTTSSVSNFEYSIPADKDAAVIFAGIETAKLKSVANPAARTVGANVAAFSWTWASQSGALTDLGL